MNDTTQITNNTWKSPDPPPTLRLSNVTKTFGDVLAVVDLSLHVAPGEVVGLVGPNGSGKSTALRVSAGLTTADAGTVDRAGDSCAYVPDDPTGFDELTISEYLTLIKSLYHQPPLFDRRANSLLTMFGLTDKTGRYLRALSHGMRRQVSIVAGISSQQDLTVIDEAAAALDPESKVALTEILRIHADTGGAALLATQELAFAEATCDRVVLMSHGEVLDSGTPADLAVRHGVAADRGRVLEEVFLTVTGTRVDRQELRDALRH